MQDNYREIHSLVELTFFSPTIRGYLSRLKQSKKIPSISGTKRLPLFECSLSLDGMVVDCHRIDGIITILWILLSIVTSTSTEEFCDSGTLDTLCEVSTKHNYDVISNSVLSIVGGSRFFICILRKWNSALHLQS